jgi:guanylate kinase
LSSARPNAIVVSAPSGSGKSTVLWRVLRELPGLRFSVSHTTRPPRPGERDGVEYHFVDHAGFDALRAGGRLLEWAEVHGQLYGTAHEEYVSAQRDGVDLLLDLDVQGAAQVRLKLPDVVTVFILPPSFGDLERRLRGRGQDDEAAIRRRLEAAREEMELFETYDYTLVNQELESCVADLAAVIRAARSRTPAVLEAGRRIVETFRGRTKEVERS